MASLGEELIDVLSNQSDLYGQVGDLLDEERDALLSRDPDSVLNIVRRKETLLLRIKTLDESRSLICVRLARQWRLPSSSMTLSDIEAREEPPISFRLTAVHETLRECLERVSVASEKNARICQNGIGMLHKVLQTASRVTSQEENTNYGKKGARAAAMSAYGSLQSVKT